MDSKKKESSFITRRDFVKTASIVMAGVAAGIGTGLASASAEDKKVPSDPKGARKVKLNIGPKGERRHVTNTRGMAFGGAAVMVGTGRNERAHVFTATSCGKLIPGSIEKIDAKKQAAELGAGVTAFMGNVGRHWTMDEIDMHVGEVVDFQGVKMCWAGDMTGEELRSQFGATLRARKDPARHQLDLQGGQAGVLAARARWHRLGHAGIYEGQSTRPSPSTTSTQWAAS